MLDGIPVYLQIADWLREQIQSGALGAGQRIPTEVQLGVQFGVARGTVRHATSVLKQECLIQVRRGRSTVVCAPPAAVISLAVGDEATTTGATVVVRGDRGIERYLGGLHIVVEA